MPNVEFGPIFTKLKTNMFQLRQLKTFLAAAETLSFTEAAKRVHLSQPSVTEQVQALEQSLGQKLFFRKNNKLTLTSSGFKLMSRARELLTMADETLRSVRDNLDEQAITLRVAAPQTLCVSLLISTLADYEDLHPGSKVVIQEKNSVATAQAVVDGIADLGLIHGWPANDAPLVAEAIARDVPVVVMPLGHPLGQAANIRPDELAKYPLIVTQEGCRYRDYLESLLQQSTTRPRVRAEAESVAALMSAVSTGIGVTILPKMAIVTTAIQGDFEFRELSETGDGLPICLLTLDQRRLPHIAAFIEILRLSIASSNEPMSTLDVEHGASHIAVANQK